MNTSFVIFHLLLSWWTLIALQSFVHFFMIEEMSDRPVYLQWGILRAMAAIFYGIPYNVMDFWQWLPILAFQVSSHFVIFNPFVTRLRYIKWRELGAVREELTFWYLGKDSGWFDRLFIRDLKFYKAIYFFSIAVLIISIVVIYDTYL